MDSRYYGTAVWSMGERGGQFGVIKIKVGAEVPRYRKSRGDTGEWEVAVITRRYMHSLTPKSSDPMKYLVVECSSIRISHLSSKTLETRLLMLLLGTRDDEAHGSDLRDGSSQGVAG